MEFSSLWNKLERILEPTFYLQAASRLRLTSPSVIYFIFEIFSWQNYPEKRDFSSSTLEVLFWQPFSCWDSSTTTKSLRAFCFVFADSSTVYFLIFSLLSRGCAVTAKRVFPCYFTVDRMGDYWGDQSIGKFHDSIYCGSSDKREVEPSGDDRMCNDRDRFVPDKVYKRNSEQEPFELGEVIANNRGVFKQHFIRHLDKTFDWG